MKIKLLGVVAFLTIICTSSFAQYLDIKWSEREIYKNGLNGEFDGFIGSNSSYIYGKMTNFSSGDVNLKQFSLVAFDKNTMKKVTQNKIIDPKKPNKEYKGLAYQKTVVFENIIYVFWTKYSKQKTEVFAESFDTKLKRSNPLKKVYEVAHDKSKAKQSEVMIMGNKEAGERIFLGAELAADKNQNVVFEYKLLNNNFQFEAASQVTLPITVKGKGGSLSSDYELGNDGNLHVKTFITVGKEDAKNLKKGESSTFPFYSVVNLNSGDIKSYPFKFESKNIYNFNYLIEKNTIKLFGFFSDLNKDPKGNDTHGIFYAIIDSKTLDMEDVNLTYFSKEQINKLFAKDREDRNQSLFAGKKKAASQAESLAGNYVIEKVQSIDKDNLLLFTSKMRNYSVTTCDSRGNCVTSYYCEKSNVTAFRIKSDGTVVWSANLDRKKTYSGWHVYDLKVMNKDDKFYVAYGSDFAMNANKKNFSSKKSGKHQRDLFEYAVFDYNTGDYKKYEHKVNSINTKSQDRKTIAATNIAVLDGEFYSTSIKKSVRPGFWFCPAVYICPFILNTPGARKGVGHLGRISPVN
jgi:hypothetical protein